ncbi:hypothetical protein RDV89_17550 [Nocardioides zeae]|uniref:Uncharacterized protein n=1 Tax=Nocardioides imazamoxiresistens TaxID=3231893 RepID=A0ABU3Q048_9ACTN|nr:hypothetical protein [Nocardioides zeae]MDT9594898.1 hypothetical protein [Nocardioides zeae]
MDLGDLPALWAQVEALHDEVVNLPPPLLMRALTLRAFDEAKPAGVRAYMAVHRHLGVAMDNHYALRHLLEHYAATLSAPWSLLRPTLEAAFRALWIIDPELSGERRLRGFQSEVCDAAEGDKHLREFERVAELRSQVLDSLRRRAEGPDQVCKNEARQLGVKWPVVTTRVNLVRDLPRLRPVIAEEGDLLGPWLISQWRLMSGFEHGLAWAMMRGSDSEPRLKIPGGQEMVLTINDEAFGNASKAAMFLLRHALWRLRYLHITGPALS